VDRQDIASTTVLRAVDLDVDPDDGGMIRRRRSGATAARAASAANPRGRTPWPTFTAAGASLGAILVVQAASTMTAYAGFSTSYPASDAVTRGHQYLHHLLHGGPGPEAVRTQGGAPFLAPAVFAAADTVGGSALVAMLVTALLVGATIAAYLTARRLRTPAVGVIAAGVFAVSVVVRPAAVTTCFAALALCVIAWAFCHAVRFGSGDSRNLLPTSAALMVLANYADYATFWWDPLIVLAILVVRPEQPDWQHGRSWNAQRFALLSGVLLVLCLLAGRQVYFEGISAFVLPRDGSALTIGVWVAAVLLGWLAVAQEGRAGQAPARRRGRRPSPVREG
jgi:hypothetical protein